MASGQSMPSGRVATECSTPGSWAWESSLLICGADLTYRYALPEDIPAPPAGGYTARPEWFPPLTNIFTVQDPPACPLTGRVTFTSPVIAPEDLSPIIPQGMMIGEHVTPIDHGYIGVRPLAKARADRTEDDFVPVRAPADGVIIEVSTLGSPTSIRVVIAHGCGTYSIYMVLNRLSGKLAHLQDELLARGGLQVTLPILAGDEFGRQRDNPIDFSVHDAAVWLPGFLGPFSYVTMESWKPYTVDPWPYFSPDLAAVYTAQMQRVAEPRWGRIDLDVAGTASGNWFLDGTMGYAGHSIERYRTAREPIPGGGVEGKTTYAHGHLAIAPHWVQPSKWVFSIGAFANTAGDARQFLLDVAPGQPAPDALTPASGPVLYQLRELGFDTPLVNEAPLPVNYGVLGGMTRGYAAVQVQEGEILHVEVFPNVSAAPAFTAFGVGRRVYRR